MGHDKARRTQIQLSIRHVTGRPVVMVGVGEKLDALEDFHPERMAGRILGMGDIVSLVEDAQEKVDQDEAQRLAERMFLKSFNLDDLLAQFEQIERMGSIKDLMKKLPKQLTQAMGDEEIDEDEIGRQKAIILSMTTWERHNPDDIHGQRHIRLTSSPSSPRITAANTIWAVVFTLLINKGCN